MSLPRYPRYKDSGVKWLGQVPEHWGVSRLGFESWVRARLGWKGLKAEEYVDDGFAFLSTPNIKGSSIDFEDANFITKERYDESPEIKLRKGDVLLAKDGSTLGTVNVVRHLPRPATVNSSIAVITPNPSLNCIFLYYLFRGSYIEQTIQRTKGGMGVPHLFQADLNKFYLPVPPLPEQAAIASFLDRETAKIDALIAEQERLIELLKEKRQAVISHAVTQGLDPNLPMKDSGIEWLGQVPEHWEVLKCGFLGRLFGSEPVPEEVVVESGELPFIKVGSLSSERFEIESWEWFVDRSVSDQFSPRAGFVVFPKRGAAIFLNKVNIVDRPALIDPNLMGWQIGNRVIPKFVAYTLKTRRLEELADVSTVPQINNKHISPERFPVPPLDEQQEIIVHLDCKTRELDTLTTEAERAIELLSERRSALISAAVTGQIDVRGIAPEKAA